MILWLTGNTGSGKTTFAKHLADKHTIILDGDQMRESINKDCDLSSQGRRENNLRIARLAKVLADQGFNIIVSVICPYEDLRLEVQEICDCKFIYLEGGKKGVAYPYEEPQNYSLKLKEWSYLDVKKRRVI